VLRCGAYPSDIRLRDRMNVVYAEYFTDEPRHGPRSGWRTPRGLLEIDCVAAIPKLDQRDGLPLPCVANCDDLTTIAKARLIRRVGRLTGVKLSELDDAMRFALQLDYIR
jgi:hypothetical protein